ncbi:MAG: ABC transporter substrate-binding protein [Nitrospinae bacterium]|nr:ABC transporter substrate-binding protein [Nitrospinota bacterium]
MRQWRLAGLALAGLSAALALWITWQLGPLASGPPPQGTIVQGDGFPRVLIDQAGRRVVLPHKPVRIISLTLATDEILLALVERARLLAVTYLAVDERVSNMPREAAAVPHNIRADVEQIIALQPDLVVVASYTRGEVVKLLQDMGLVVFQFQEFESIAAIQENIRLVSQAVGEEARAEALIRAMNTRLRAVAGRLPHGRPRPRVLYWGPRGLTGGSNTSLHDLITHAGGENLAATHGIVGFGNLSAEHMLAMNPEVIFTGGEGREAQPGLPAFLLPPGVQTVDALKHARVFMLPTRYLVTISHFIVNGVEELARVLHAEPTMRGEGL